jgi:hypothetical protein
VENVFQFSSSAYLEKLTGSKANNLKELLALIQGCPESAIFNHTFSALRKMRAVRVPYSSDFAIWIAESLNENALAEKLMVIDLVDYKTIESLRARIVSILKEYKGQHPKSFKKTSDEPFFLCDVTRVVYLTDKFAYNLRTFRDLLDTISVDSLYYHFIETRLQNPNQKDDFSSWIDRGLGLGDLAQSIQNIDISIYTLDELREKILQLIDEQLANNGGGA